MPSPRLAAVLAGPLLVLALVSSGCSSDRNVLARVGDHVITVDDFLAAARGVQQVYPGPPDSAKVRLLEDLVRRELLLCGAEAMSQPRDTAVKSFRARKEADLLAQALNNRMAATYTPVTDEEVRRYYAWRDSSTRIQVIYSFGREAAQGALDQLRHGASFSEVAARFNPSAGLPPDGDLGSQSPGDLLEPLDTIARTARPGSVTGPVQVPSRGWFLVKVIDRKRRSQPPFETERATLADMLRQRKQQQAVIARHLRMREAYDVRILPGAGQVLFAYFNPPAGVPKDSALDLARPLAQWVEPGGTRTYTFGDALHDLQTSNEPRPPATVLAGIEEWILVQTLNRVVQVEARRQRIPDEPGFRRSLDEAVNNALLDGYYSNEVIAKATQEPGDLAELYAKEGARFARLQSATLDVVEFADSASAAAFTAHGVHARTLRAAVAMVPGAPPVHTVDLSFPTPDLDWARLQPTLAAIHEGEALGPLAASRGRWRIVQLIARRIVVPPLDSLDANARGTLQQESVEVGRERRLLQLVQDLRLTYRTEVHPERLRRVPWPSASGS